MKRGVVFQKLAEQKGNMVISGDTGEALLHQLININDSSPERKQKK
jgi:hypothetical protein